MMAAVDLFAGRISQLHGKLRADEAMAAHTSWSIGGVADIYYEPSDRDDLCHFLRLLPATVAVTMVGRGSNLLVRDGGIRGAVVQTTNCLAGIRLDGAAVWVESGVPCAKLARFCAMAGLTGLEFMSGIPGTVGGALAMNAGAYGGETWQHVLSVEMVDRQGNGHSYEASSFAVGYRQVAIEPGQWFAAAIMKLRRDDPDACRERIRQMLKRRGAEQPIGEYSCGSVFSNPPGHKAAKLIDQCGLRGFRYGNAYVSPQHANFILHDGAATAADVEGLMQHMVAVVQAATGVSLQAEVRIVGEAMAEGRI